MSALLSESSELSPSPAGAQMGACVLPCLGSPPSKRPALFGKKSTAGSQLCVIPAPRLYINTGFTVSRVALNPSVYSGDWIWALDAQAVLLHLGAFWLLGERQMAETPHTLEDQTQQGLPRACPAPGATSASLRNLELAPGRGLSYFQKRHKNSFWTQEWFLSEMKTDSLWLLICRFGSLRSGEAGEWDLMFVSPSSFWMKPGASPRCARWAGAQTMSLPHTWAVLGAGGLQKDVGGELCSQGPSATRSPTRASRVQILGPRRLRFVDD